METLKAYLTVVAANVKSDAGVHFDTVSLHNIATDSGATGETEGDQNSGNALTYATNGGEKTNWVGAVLYMTASTYVSTTVNPTQQDAQKEQRAFILDVSGLTAGTSTIQMKIGSTHVFHTGSAHGAVTIANTANLASIISQLKSTTAVSRAADLGATLDVYIGANSMIPSVTLKTGSTSASGANWEGYTDAAVGALSWGQHADYRSATTGAMTANVTTYDTFTYTVGGNSVTASITLPSGFTSYTGATALAAVATAIGMKWNYSFGTPAGEASGSLSFWSLTSSGTAGTIGDLALKSANSGSRGYGQGVSFAHNKATAAQVSLATASVATSTFIDWLIGTDDAQLAATDNKATDVDLIITLEEVLASGSAINGTAATINLKGLAFDLDELSTAKTKTGVLSGTLSTDIFENDAGIYGSIGSGGAGDVRDPENADEGIATTTTTGSVAAKRTRIHWLG